MRKILFLITLVFFNFQIVHASQKKGDVIMLTHGVYDMIFQATEAELQPFVKELGIKIGDSKLVDLKFYNKLLERFKPMQTAFGGSASNTAYIMSLLGSDVGMYVLLSSEDLANQYMKDLQNVGVKNFAAYMSDEQRGRDSVVAKVGVFISHKKNGAPERTMFAYHGLCTDFTNIKFDFSKVKDYKVLYIEGYVFSPESKKVVFDAIDIAKKHGTKIAFTPSSPHMINAYRDDFQRIIDSSDILFTNRQEIRELYPGNDIKDAIKKISKRVDITIVTEGKDGSLIMSDKGKNSIQILERIDQKKVVDTTGAGDGYLAGFLYRYTRGDSIENSGKVGAIVANNLIQEISARPSASRMKDIKKELGLM